MQWHILYANFCSGCVRVHKGKRYLYINSIVCFEKRSSVTSIYRFDKGRPGARVLLFVNTRNNVSGRVSVHEGFTCSMCISKVLNFKLVGNNGLIVASSIVWQLSFLMLLVEMFDPTEATVILAVILKFNWFVGYLAVMIVSRDSAQSVYWKYWKCFYK